MITPPKEIAMPWDVTAAVQHLRDNAEPQSTGHCARYVREAIEAGGLVIGRTTYAKDYGAELVRAGFSVVNRPGYATGDVVVIQPPSGRTEGHMAMFDGEDWISDFVQNGLYPGPAYRTAEPDYVIYRYATAAADPVVGQEDRGSE